MNRLVSILFVVFFCYSTLFAQDKSSGKSYFYKMNVGENNSALLKEPGKDVLIKGNPQFKTWVLNSLSNKVSSGIWESTPGKWKFANSHWEYCRILSGISIISEDNGNRFTVKAGDSFILKPGFSGTWEVIETTRKDFVAISQDEKNDTQDEKKITGIIKTIEYYIDGGRKGNSKITAKAFSKNATMSWTENGQLKSVPIQVLYDIVDNGGASKASYKLIKYNIESNIAIVQIQSQFGIQQYMDMFTLVKDGHEWKIISKVYTTL